MAVRGLAMAGPYGMWSQAKVADGAPAGEGDGHHKIVVLGAGSVADAEDFPDERVAVVDARGDAEQALLHKDAKVGEQIAAGDELLAGFFAGAAGGQDGDGGERATEVGTAEEFDDRAADAAGIDDESAGRRGERNGRGGQAGRLRFEQASKAFDDLDVRGAESEAFGMIEAETEGASGLPGDVIEFAGEFPGALEDDEGRGILALTEIETVEDVIGQWLRHREESSGLARRAEAAGRGRRRAVQGIWAHGGNAMGSVHVPPRSGADCTATRSHGLAREMGAMSLATEQGMRRCWASGLPPRSGAVTGIALTHGLRHGLLSFALRAEDVFEHTCTLERWRVSSIWETPSPSYGATHGELAKRSGT